MISIPSTLLIEGPAVKGDIPTAGHPVTGTRRSDWALDWFDLIILLALVLSYVLVAYLPFAPNKYGDLDYHVEAKALAGAVRGDSPWRQVQIFRATGPVLYYAVPYLLVVPGSPDQRYWLAGFLWTAGWMALVALLIRRTAAGLAGELAGRISAVLLLLTPFWAYYSFGINGEVQAFIGVAICTYAWVRWEESAAAAHAARWPVFILGMGLAIFFLSKPIGASLLLPMLAAAGIDLARGKRREARGLIIAVLLAALLFGLGAGLARFSTRDRRISPQVSYLHWNMFIGSFQFRTEPWDWRFWGRATRQGSVDYQMFSREFAQLAATSKAQNVSMSDLEWKWIVNDFIHHPLLRMKMTAVRALALNVFLNGSRPSNEFRLGPLRGQTGYAAFHVALNLTNLVVLALAIYFLAQRRADLLRLWVFWAPWVALFFYHSLFYAEARYVFPGQPGLLILAGAGLAPWVRRLQSITSVRALRKCGKAPSAQSRESEA